MLGSNQVILVHVGNLWIVPGETGEPLQQGKALKTLAGLSFPEEGRKHDH